MNRRTVWAVRVAKHSQSVALAYLPTIIAVDQTTKSGGEGQKHIFHWSYAPEALGEGALSWRGSDPWSKTFRHPFLGTWFGFRTQNVLRYNQDPFR